MHAVELFAGDERVLLRVRPSRVAIVLASLPLVRASRDGVALGEKTFAPPYRVSPRPNGPGCEPKECKQATVPFP